MINVETQASEHKTTLRTNEQEPMIQTLTNICGYKSRGTQTPVTVETSPQDRTDPAHNGKSNKKNHGGWNHQEPAESEMKDIYTVLRAPLWWAEGPSLMRAPLWWAEGPSLVGWGPLSDEGPSLVGWGPSGEPKLESLGGGGLSPPCWAGPLCRRPAHRLCWCRCPGGGGGIS